MFALVAPCWVITYDDNFAIMSKKNSFKLQTHVARYFLFEEKCNTIVTLTLV